jgi:hypothetical protein
MRTADERLRTLRLPGIGGLETVGPLDRADQLADGDATFDGDELELIPDRVFNNDTGWAAIGAHASTIAVLQQLGHGCRGGTCRTSERPHVVELPPPSHSPVAVLFVVTC